MCQFLVRLLRRFLIILKLFLTVEELTWLVRVPLADRVQHRLNLPYHLVLALRHYIQPFLLLDGVVAILENLLVNVALSLAVSSGHFETLPFSVPKVFVKTGEHILNPVAEIHKHPNGHHLDRRRTQVVLIQKLFNIRPVKEEHSHLLKVKLLVGSLIKVIQPIHKHILIQTVRIGVQLRAGPKGSPPDLVVNELSR